MPLGVLGIEVPIIATRVASSIAKVLAIGVTKVLAIGVASVAPRLRGIL